MNKTDTSHIAFVPKGDSMWPFLKNKKQTVIINKDYSDILEFDVILYSRANGDKILHRVIKVTEKGLICSGDSQFVLEKVNLSQVEGVMVGFYKKDKYQQVDQNYREKVRKFYKNSNKRKRKIKRFFFTKKVLYKIKRIIKGK